MTNIDMLFYVAPDALQRADRLAFALRLLQQEHQPERDVRKRIQRRYGVSRVTAWRTVSMAKDIM